MLLSCSRAQCAIEFNKDIVTSPIKVKLKRDRFETRQCLANAWNILLDDGEENIRTDDARLKDLFAFIKPNNTKDENTELIEMLDADNDGIIENFDWTTMLLDVLQIDFYDTNRSSELEPEWKIFGSWSTFIKNNHSLFKRIIIGKRFIMIFPKFTTPRK